MLRATLALLPVALASQARAHPAPAEAPDFPATQCVTVVDRDAQKNFDIEYSLLTDDTMFGLADIPLPDAKTHQFFAVAGAVASDAVSYQVFPFRPADAEPIELPLWITVDDVKRAAHASGTVEGAMFSQSDVPDGTTLADSSALAGLWQRVTQDDARVPITLEQAKQGARWNVQDVTPGVYSIAAYIFSPPYNGWAVRPGVIKVVDGEHDMPAGTIDSIDEFVFSYQGRRVSACLDVPKGTRLDAYFNVEERPEAGWMRWISGREVESGQLDLCFHDPKPELTGSVRMRFDLTGPDGTLTTLHSADTITALQGSGPCIASDTLCCDFEGGQPGTQAGEQASGPAPGASVTGTDAGMAARAAPSPSHASSCDVAMPGAASGTRAPWIAGLAALACIKRRRARN
jgi:hypothetical protein